MNRVKSLRCALCGEGIINCRYKAMLQWNISGELCGKCYGKRLTEHYISAERQTTISAERQTTISAERQTTIKNN